MAAVALANAVETIFEPAHGRNLIANDSWRRSPAPFESPFKTRTSASQGNLSGGAAPFVAREPFGTSFQGRTPVLLGNYHLLHLHLFFKLQACLQSNNLFSAASKAISRHTCSPWCSWMITVVPTATSPHHGASPWCTKLHSVVHHKTRVYRGSPWFIAVIKWVFPV